MSLCDMFRVTRSGHLHFRVTRWIKLLTQKV